jgi:hypothetical protein
VRSLAVLRDSSALRSGVNSQWFERNYLARALGEEEGQRRFGPCRWRDADGTGIRSAADSCAAVARRAADASCVRRMLYKPSGFVLATLKASTYYLS